MKRPVARWVSEKRGFTLVEVLIALAIAAIGFGVALHSLGLQMSLVSSAIDRHQMLMYASEALESKMAQGTLGEEDIGKEDIIGHFDEGDKTGKDGAGKIQASKYLYSVDAKPVTADPRVQQVSVTVKGDRGIVRLSAYRLRVKRDE